MSLVYEEVKVRPFPRELSKDFLRVGFSEVGLKVPEEEIEKAVNELDGISCWLVEFGFNYWRRGSFECAMGGMIARAQSVIREEPVDVVEKNTEGVKSHLLRGLYADDIQTVPENLLNG